MLYFPYEKKTEASRFFHWFLILSSAQSIKESGICGHLLRSPIRKNRPLRLSLLRISAGISPFIFSASFFLITRRYRLVTRINITTQAFSQGVISKSFSLYLICRKNLFFVVFLNIFLGFLAVLLIQELRTVLEQD